ncbi:unnamed protein product [Ambrosiozyma monospora]|uniref:Unnamed protein product n=1 Tax=Ambrosiozyma monospora TaxID=43982 RepID=A0ACB5U1P7_AMBMO|nr:unnamed protein product [Ambrosiozyma monospora]
MVSEYLRNRTAEKNVKFANDTKDYTSTSSTDRDTSRRLTETQKGMRGRDATDFLKNRRSGSDISGTTYSSSSSSSSTSTRVRRDTGTPSTRTRSSYNTSTASRTSTPYSSSSYNTTGPRPILKQSYDSTEPVHPSQLMGGKIPSLGNNVKPERVLRKIHNRKVTPPDLHSASYYLNSQNDRNNTQKAGLWGFLSNTAKSLFFSEPDPVSTPPTYNTGKTMLNNWNEKELNSMATSDYERRKRQEEYESQRRQQKEQERKETLERQRQRSELQRERDECEALLRKKQKLAYDLQNIQDTLDKKREEAGARMVDRNGNWINGIEDRLRADQQAEKYTQTSTINSSVSPVTTTSYKESKT